MELIKCDEAHIPMVRSFYHRVVAYLETHINYPFWSSGHPSDEGIAHAVSRGEQYACVDGDQILGAFVLSEDPEGYYEAGDWSRELKRGEFLSVHVLAVSPEGYQSGVGSFMVNACIAIARKGGYQALRLDIVPTNTPAKRLYQKMGFVCAGTKDLQRNIEEIPLFELYELNIDRTAFA